VVTRGRPCRDGNAGPCVGSPLYRVISSSGVTLGPVISNWLNCEATWKNAGALYASAPLLAAPSAVAQTCGRMTATATRYPISTNGTMEPTRTIPTAMATGRTTIGTLCLRTAAWS
jgi:hypothetical protein